MCDADLGLSRIETAYNLGGPIIPEVGAIIAFSLFELYYPTTTCPKRTCILKNPYLF